ncbi:MAG: hypothetical protein HONBIEJF_00019 [Fimbriimonadaceae bacterium]|nr:hypothetical protein [Fimbriimonadaceae bacterium]
MIGTVVAALFLNLIFADPVLVTPPSFSRAREPQVAIDVDEQVYIAYGMGNAVYVSVSSDRGASYGDPIKVAEPGKLSLGMRRGPRICVRKGVLTITAVYGSQGNWRDGDIVAFRSADKGKTWSGPVLVNDVEGSGREGLHAMAVAPDGTLACAWLDLRDKGTKLFMATSKDGGGRWSDNRLVYASPSGTICECCHPSLAFDAKGRLHVMFRNSIDGARDMYITSSGDLRTFSPATKLGLGTWMINACPMDGGMLAVSPTGSVETIWRREGMVFQSRLSGEERIGEGRNPWIAHGAAGTYLAWQSGKEVIYLAPGSNPSRVSQEGNDPVIAASPNGRLVIGAWNQNGIRSIRL